MTNTTTIVPTVDMTVVTDYRNADQKGKARIRATVDRAFRDAVRNLDMASAASAQATLDALVTVRPESVKVDPNVVIARRVRTLMLAANLLANAGVIPSGIDADDIDADAILSAMDDITDDDVMTDAVKLADVKITRASTRRDIQGVIDRAFDGTDAGTFLTVAEIRTRGQLSDYVPSDGAIAARLFPRNGSESTLEGVVATDSTASNVRGATSI